MTSSTGEALAVVVVSSFADRLINECTSLECCIADIPMRALRDWCFRSYAADALCRGVLVVGYLLAVAGQMARYKISET